MKIIENLISRYCPDGVEYVDLGEVVVFTDGHSFSSGSFTESGEYQVVKITDIFGGLVNRGKTFINELPEKLKNGQQLSGGEILVAMSGSTGKTGYNTLSNAVVNQRIAILRNQDCIENGYLKHLLVNGTFETYCFKNGTGPQNNISKAQLLRYRIPLPPLPIQQEIVRILDTFTNLTAELTAELTARRKQYEYYRDELLTFGEDVPKLCLSEIATEMYRGSGIKRDEVSESGIPCVRYGEIYTTYDVQFNKCVSHVDPKKVSAPKYFEYGDVLFAITGESVSDIAKSVVYLGSDICLAGGDIVVMKHKQNPKYMAYALSTTNAQIQKSKGKVKSKVVHSSMPSLREIRIPIPSLIEQEKIANILDNFRKLCNGFDEGLPAEISARQKQYEYYRDKLLQFSV